MSEIAKRLDKAEKLLQKGKLTSALDEFRAVLSDDLSNDHARHRAADLCLSLNLNDEATEYLIELFDSAAAQNRNAEAVQAFKKLQRIGSVSSERTLRYAQMLLSSSPREALESFRAAFRDFQSRGEKSQALEAIRHMVALDPSPENYRYLADLCVALGDRQSGAVAYWELGRMEEASGLDGAAAFAQAHALDPENSDIALLHARCLLRANEGSAAAAVLHDLPLTTPEYFEAYANALLMAGRLKEAEVVILKLYDQSPSALPLMGQLIDGYLAGKQALLAVGLARAMESRVHAQDGKKEFLAMVREIADRYPAATEFLEYLAYLFNTSNREHEYCDTLLKLFELHFAQRNFTKAAECLDRATEVDAYEPGHAERLETLRGKIDANKFNTIANRLAATGGNRAEADDHKDAPAPEPEKPEEPTILEDLMLQAEIFLQYSMRSKAVERLERINKLFPREEEQREKLAELYTAAGFVPKYGTGSDIKALAAATSTDENAVDNFAKVTEITRNIARQSSVKAVLFTTVNDVGRHWAVSRCVAGLSAPGKPPSAAMEYCAPGVTKSDVMGLARLISTLQAQVVNEGGAVSFEHAQRAPELESIRPVLTTQKIESLMAVPLQEGDEHVGIVIMEQCGSSRNFGSVDRMVLNTIAEQIVLAVNNARLRTLVKTLAVTDEKSGLLRRSSYLDVLHSEVRRSLAQKSPVTLLLMKFGSAGALIKEVGEERLEAAMQEIGQIVTANIRQTDIAARYDLTGIVLILSDTTDKNAFFVLDKLRKAISSVRIGGRAEPFTVTAGIAELVMQPAFDAVDIVTEGINRVESALEMARIEGGNCAHAMAPMYEATTTSA